MRMRLELALIAGIVFFCCWCAYIATRMNASVSGAIEQATPTSGSSLAPASSSGASSSSGTGSAANLGQVALNTPNNHPSSGDTINWQQQQQQQRAYQLQMAALRGQYEQPTHTMKQVEPINSHPPHHHHRHHHHQLQHQLVANWPLGSPGALINQAGANHAIASSAPEARWSPQWQQAALPAQLQHQMQLLPDHRRILLPGAAQAEPDRDEAESTSGPISGYDRNSATAGVTATGAELPDDASLPVASKQAQNEQDDADQDLDQNQDDQDQDDEAQEGGPFAIRGQDETDEGSQRRRFSETDDDSSERDADGQVISSWRRHLINGKPVKTTGRLLKDAAPGTRRRQGGEKPTGSRRIDTPSASGSAPDPLSEEAADFERLVREIDANKPPSSNRQPGHRDQSQRQDHELANEESSNKLATLLDRRMDSGSDTATKRVGKTPEVALGTGKAPPGQSNKIKIKLTQVKKPAAAAAAKKQPADVHEHQLHETLEAKRWDDDGAQDKVDSDADSNDGEMQSGEALADEEAQKLERLALDLIGDADDDADNNNGTTNNDADVDRNSPAPETAATEQGGGDGDNGDDSADDTDQTEHEDRDGPSVIERANLARSRRHIEQVTSREDHRLPLQDTVMFVESNSSRKMWPLPGYIQVANLTNNGSQLMPLEDINVEVLAPRPPGFPVAAATTNNGTTGDIDSARPALNPIYVFKGQTGYSSMIPANSSGGQLVPFGQFPADVAQHYPIYHQRLPVHFAHAPSATAEMQADFPQVQSPFASGSWRQVDKVPVKKRKNKANKGRKSAGSSSRLKSAKALEMQRKSKRKKGKMYKKRLGNELKYSSGRKHFKGSTKGQKASKGLGHRGANKGATKFKDKGYKKRGFKKVYHKLETGDHKTYFDEFRDKDHKSKWKKFDDKHKYSKSKKWAGGDAKRLKHHDLKAIRNKSFKGGQWTEKAKSRRSSKGHKMGKSRADHWDDKTKSGKRTDD